MNDLLVTQLFRGGARFSTALSSLALPFPCTPAAPTVGRGRPGRGELGDLTHPPPSLGCLSSHTILEPQSAYLVL